MPTRLPQKAAEPYAKKEFVKQISQLLCGKDECTIGTATENSVWDLSPLGDLFRWYMAPAFGIVGRKLGAHYCHCLGDMK